MEKSTILGTFIIGIFIVLTALIQPIPETDLRSPLVNIHRSSYSAVDFSWEAHSLPITNNLHAITGLDNQLWVVGANGILFHSTDYGTSWVARDTHFTGTWFSVAFINQSHGFIAGMSGAFARSTDGGTSWQMINLGITSNLLSQSWINTTHGWIAGSNGLLLFTQNCGLTWTPRSLSWSNDINSVLFFNNTLGWIIGSSGLVAITHTGGSSWNVLSVPIVADWNTIEIDEKNSTWISGTAGTLLVTKNNGNSWTTVDTGITSTISTLLFYPTTTLMFAGNNGICLGTTNSGSTWISYVTATTLNILDNYVSSTAMGWLVGTGGLLLSKVIAPRVTITNPDNGTYTQNNIPINYNSSYGSTTVFVDGVANSTAIPSGSILSSLTEGNHNLTIVSIDEAGNTGKQMILFSVDTIIPIITINSPSNITYSQNSITITYSVSDGSTTVFLDDTANTTALPSGSLLPGLSETSHNLTIQAIDKAGNIGKSTVFFTVDMTIPIVIITSPTNRTYAQNSTTLTYSVSEGSVTVYLDDTANTTALPSGSLLPELSETSHNLTIKAIDKAGNIGKSTVFFSVDTTIPIVTITSPTNRTYAQSSTTLTYSASKGNTTVYLDGTANNTAIPSGSILSSLTEESHNLTITVNDTAGNVGKTTVYFTVDMTSPIVIITSPTNRTYAQNSTTLTYSVSEGSVTVYLDDTANTTALPSGSLLPELSETSHNLTIKAIDKAGNIGKSTVFFSVDTTIPIVTITSPTNRTYAQSSTTLTYSASKGNTTVYLDGTANNTAIPSGSILSSLTEESHNLTITVNDTAGNVGKTTVYFTVDITSPIVIITSPTNSTYTQNSTTLIYSVSEGSVTVYLDGTANNTAIPSSTILSNLSEGSHNLTIKAIDIAGNVEILTRIFTVDTVAPTITITSPTMTAYSQNSIILRYTASEEGLITIYLDGNANISSNPSNSLIPSIADGVHNLTITNVDVFGNKGKKTVIFTIDTILPVITINNPKNSTYSQNNLIMNYSVSEGTVTIYFDGIANVTSFPSGNSLSSIINGIHNLTIYAIDDAGNTGRKTIIFTINAPITTSTTASTNPNTETTASTESSKVSTPSTSSGIPTSSSSTSSKKSASSISAVNLVILFSFILFIYRYKKRIDQ